MDESEWREATRRLGWSEARSGRARALAKHRQSRARADAVDLTRAQAGGEDPRAWATKRGWDEDRTRAAMRFVKPPS